MSIFKPFIKYIYTIYKYIVYNTCSIYYIYYARCTAGLNTVMKF